MPTGVRKLTNSTDETSISDLFANNLVFGIPYFQRAYKWNEKNIDRFEDDLENLLDYEETSHFLGAIIVFSKPTNPADPKFYEVIDGQQRLTTCYLALMALAKVFSTHEMIDDAFALYRQYLIVWRTNPNITNAKLICSKEDHAAFNAIFHDLTANPVLKSQIQSNNLAYRPMSDTGLKTGRAYKNYQLFVKYFNKKYDEQESVSTGEGQIILRNFFSRLVGNMRVVQIIVMDPTDGPKIFDSLNSKQEPITIGDLVRNELFAKYADHGDAEIDTLDREYWHPFYERFKQKNNEAFDKVFEQYFFPYVLTLKSSTKKADAFNFLRERWATEEDPIKIIQDLRQYQDIYLDLHYGTSLTQCPPEIKKAMYRLSRMETPTSVYPFLLHVVAAVIDNSLAPSVATDILEHIESFLVRRVVCGYEPTGLHATFKSLWDDCNQDYSIENVVANIKRHSTVKWPNDEEFTQSLKTRPLYKVKMTPYLLAEWNGYLGGDIPEIPSEQIEHVLPENPDETSQWVKDWSKKQREDKKHCLANLLPISGSLNSSIQNADYSQKRIRYIEDSALKAPRMFGQQYEVWTPDEFEKRADELTSWALHRWKY